MQARPARSAPARARRRTLPRPSPRIRKHSAAPRNARAARSLGRVSCIAKLADEHKHPDAAGLLTETGIAIGTATYMSPEQGAAVRELTDRSDVYALGVLLYQLLSGAPPFVAKTWALVLHMHRTQPPMPLDVVCADIDPRLSELTGQMLEKNPSRRPTMREVVSCLDDILGELGAGAQAVAPLPPRRTSDSALQTESLSDSGFEVVIEALPEEATQSIATAMTARRGGRSG